MKELQLTYTQQGDYLLPNLKLPEQPKVEIGVFGQRHKRYLKEHHRLIYFNLLTSCKLAAYLADIDSQANEMYDLLVRQLSEEENISEQLKSDNPIEWARKMNTIRLTATEIVNRQPRDNLHISRITQKHPNENRACKQELILLTRLFLIIRQK